MTLCSLTILKWTLARFINTDESNATWLTNHEQAEVDIAIQEKVSQSKITLAHTKEKVYQILIFSTLNVSSSASKEISGSFQGSKVATLVKLRKIWIDNVQVIRSCETFERGYIEDNLFIAGVIPRVVASMVVSYSLSFKHSVAKSSSAI